MDFLGLLSGLGAAVDIGTNLWKTKYNYDMNKRDFDYQKSLQEQIFQREDTAVQRRMEDLKAAGINPNLAAGSAAGAGSVVSRSSTNDLNPGSVLDSIAAANQIKLQRQEQENKKIENGILKAERTTKAMNSALDMYYSAMQFGFNPRIKPIIKNGSIQWDLEFPRTEQNKMTDTPMFKLFKNNFDHQIKAFDYLDNSNKYLEKQLQWYNANQIADMLTGGIGAITGITNAGANVKRANNMIRR